jgi:hypothetical protein
MADAKVSKTFDHNGRVGSTPTFGTKYLVQLACLKRRSQFQRRLRTSV